MINLTIKSMKLPPQLKVKKILNILYRIAFPIKHLSKKNKRILIISSIVIILIFIPIVIYTLTHLRGAQAAWFDQNFGYRQRVDITNAGSAQTDYQVAITLDTATLITAGKMRANCNDIRITDTNGKILPQWLQRNAGACNTSTTKIWVRVPSISTTGNALYVYYGNPQASNSEDGGKVFDAGNIRGFFYAHNQSVHPTTQGELDTFFASGLTGFQGQQLYTTIDCTSNACDPFDPDDDNYATHFEGLIYAPTTGTYNFAVDGDDAVEIMIDGNFTASASAGTNAANWYGGHGIANAWTHTGSMSLSVGYHVFRFRHEEIAGGDSYRAAWQKPGDADYSIIPQGNFYSRQYALTAPTIAAPTNEENGPGPVAYWKFDEGTGTSAKDSTSNNNTGTLTNMASPSSTNSGWMKEDACISGKCLAFDGANDYVLVNSSFNKPTNLSISVWFKTASSGVIVNQTNFLPGEAPSSYVPTVTVNSNGTLRAEYWTGSVNAITTSFAVNDSKWHHVEFVGSGSSQTLYVDGRLIDTRSGTIDHSWWTKTTFGTGYVGSNRGGLDVWTYFNGVIDEPKIYNYARTAAQIKVDYNSRGGSGAEVLGTSDSSRNLTNGLVGYWKMDESLWNGTAREVKDSSGAGNDGTAASGAVASGSAKFGPGGLFDGTNDYVDAGNGSSLGLTGDITVSAWVKPTNFTNITSIITKGYSPYSYWFGIAQTTGKPTFQLSGLGQVDANTALTTGVWSHIVGIRQGTTMKIYINGVLDNTATVGSGSLSTAAVNVYLGGDNASHYLTGQQDESRIYNRALPDREVQQLYNFAPGPIAYYKMEEKSGTSVADSSTYANNASFVGSPSWVSGKYGTGVSNDNTTSDYVNAPNVDIPNGDWTAMSWFKYPLATTGSSWHTLFRGNIIDHQVIVQRSDMQLGVFDNYGSGFHGCGFIMSTLSSGWHHISVVGTANTENFYIDGVYKCQSNFKSISDIKAIGNYQGGGQNWGQIDEVKIYNYARTTGQIVEDMNAGHPAPGSPVGSALVHLKFDDGFGNYASNSGNIGASGNAGLYNMANPATGNSGWTQHGKFGKALSFDGTNDYVDGGNNLDVGSNVPITVSAWVNVNTPLPSTSWGHGVVTKGGFSWTKGYALLVRGANDVTNVGKAEFTVETGGVGNGVELIAGPDLRGTGWHHLVGVRDPSSGFIGLYVDGKLVSSTINTTYATADLTNTSYNLNIGRETTEPDYFAGKIDEVKIYNGAMTASQVKLEYNRGSSQVLGSLSDTSGLTGGSVASNSANAEYCVPGDTATCTAPVGRWDFEEGQGSTTNDISGKENTGTLTNTSFTSGKFGKGLAFNGSTSKVSIANESNFDFEQTDSFSIETWIKKSPTGLSEEVFSKMQDGAPYVGYEVYVGSDSRVHFFLNNTYSSNTLEVNGNDNVADGKWHHIAVSYTGTKTPAGVFMYVDGIRQTLTTSLNSLNGSILNNYSPNIGVRQTGIYLNANLDHLLVFNYARSAAQVAWDYNKGTPTGWYKFDECQGATIHDSIGLTSTISGTLTVGGSGTQTSIGTCATASTAWGNGVTGKLNYSLKFDGTDDYVSIPDADMINDFPYNQDFSVSAWLKIPASQNNTAATENMIIEKWDEAGAGDYPYVIRVANQTGGASAGKVYGARYDGTHAPSAMSTNALNDNTWHHVVFTKRGSTLYFYVDGKLNNTTTDTTTTTTTNTSALFLGRRGSGNGYYYTGGIDDLRIYNYGLTASQIKVIYNNGAVNFGPSTGAP